MADPSFDVVFAGQILEGVDPQRVRANVAKLFDIDAARVEKLFSGQRIVIKKDVGAAAAQKYQAVMAKAGAVVEIVEKGAPRESAVHTVASPSPAPPPAGSQDLSMAEPGVLLVEPDRVEAPAIDTSHLQLAEVGATLTESEPIPEPQFDLSGMELAPPGTLLIESKPAKPAEFDTSGLALTDN
jgi:hypothetical protein